MLGTKELGAGSWCGNRLAFSFCCFVRVGVGHGCLKFLNGTLVWIQEDNVGHGLCPTLLPVKEMIKSVISV